MSFNQQHIAYTEINNEHTFTLTVPTLFSMRRSERQDILDLFKEFKGHWNPSSRSWIFKKEVQGSLFGTLKFYNLIPTQRFSTKSEIVTTSEKQIIEPKKQIMVNVPTLIKPAPSKTKIVTVEKNDVIKDILTLQKEFQRLHNKTGIGKTNMIKILRAAVPAITHNK